MVTKKQLQIECDQVTDLLIDHGFDLGGQIGLHDRFKKEDVFLLGRQFQLLKLIQRFD
ncbi:MAG: hypothetical protein KAR39_13050 [Thermoplasmata archaeon]|nr:hypothetical protein [Thermoplasmata archaeon]